MTSQNKKQASQQYELKLGVIHHPLLKTVQLLEFLQNQTNQFLVNELPRYIKGDQKFVSVMESLNIQENSFSEYSFQQYVGLLMIYSTSSDQSYDYFVKYAQSILQMDYGDLFLLAIQMDNSEKQANLIGNAGQKFCSKNQLQFVRLTLYNSEDLTNLINKNLYELIQNYYYPNQEAPQQHSATNRDQYLPSLTQAESKQNRSSQQKGSEYVFSYDDQSRTIKVFNDSYSPEVENTEQIMSHAVSLRKSRQRQIILEQQQLDQSIQNIQNVLNNINHRIKEKLQSGWFTSIKNKLYSTAEKDNQNFSKIKLTQQFIDEEPSKKNKKFNFNSSILQSRYSDSVYLSFKSFPLNFNSLKLNSSSIKTPIIRLVLFFSKQKVVEIQANQNSSYDDLALIAIRKLGLNQSERNVQKMTFKIRKRIENFSKQLQKAIKTHQQKKIHERSFIKSKTNQERGV